MSAPVRPSPDLAAAEAVAVLMTEVSEGTLTAATMADRAVARCREIFRQCDGPTDPLWPAHLDVCRAVLGHAGLPAAELAQWLAVARNRENPGGAVDCPSGSVSSLCGPHSLDCGGTDAAIEADLELAARQVDSMDTVDTDEFADVPDDVLAEAEVAALAVIEQFRREAET